MPIPELYQSRQLINQFQPGEWVTLVCIFAWLLVGLYQSRSVHLSKIAE